MQLREVCELIVDCPHSTAQDEGVGYPLVRTPNIGKGRFIWEKMHRVSEEVYQKRNARATPQNDDLILAREAPAGNVAIIKNDEKFCLGQRTVLIRPDKSKVDPSYLTYYLLSPEPQNKLLSNANGATVSHINIPVIRNLPIEIPDISNQAKIASILSAYDSLIDNNKRQIKLLEEAAQRLYKEWFVDLRFPGHENVKVVDGVPEGWRIGALNEVVNVKYGKDHKNIPNGDIPIYGSGGFMRGGAKSLYSGESVLIPRKGSLNNIMYVNEEFWTVDTMFYTEMKYKNTGIYIYYFMKSFDMYSWNIGAAVPSMTTNILNGLSILLPSERILEDFYTQTSTFFTKISVLKKQIHNLFQARDRLLPKLMNGEIEV